MKRLLRRLLRLLVMDWKWAARVPRMGGTLRLK